jgi:threonine/homoserine/homoserine lactone efflux protein
MAESLASSPVLASLGLGLALAGAPGPVQAVLLAEAVRGGLTRGLRAMAGAHLTFGLLLVGGALGVSAAAPSALALKVLQTTGGLFLLWSGAGALRAEHQLDVASARLSGLSPALRGALAVVFNPGGWLFVAVAAVPLFASAGRNGGSGVWSALALLAGAAIGDGSIVLLGGMGIRRADKRTQRRVRIALALALLAFGLGWLTNGVLG